MNGSKRSFWYKFFYGDVDKTFYTGHNEYVYKGNTSVLKYGYLFAIFFAAILCLAYSFNEATLNLSIFYLISMCALSISFTIFILTLKKKDERLIHMFYWIFSILSFANAIYISTIASPNNLAVIFYPALIIIPLIYVEPPYQSYIQMTLASLSFVIFDAISKPINLFTSDCVTLIWTLPLAVLFGLYHKNFNVKHLEGLILFRKEAQFDKITNVYNKAAVESYVEGIMQSRHNDLAFIVVDIDGFKDINYKWGHNQGDTILSRIGRILNNVFESHATVGRISGDQFLVFVENVFDKDLVINKIKQASKNIENVFQDHSHETISTSYGVLFVEQKDRDITYDQAIDFTVKALIESKTSTDQKITIYDSIEEGLSLNQPLAIVADKSEVSRNLICSSLFKNNYKIIKTDDANYILNNYKEFSKNLAIIIADFEIKNMTAIQMFKKLKNYEEYDSIIKIMLTSYEEVELEALNLGVDEVILKPIELERMKTKVENIERRIKHGKR